LIALALVLLAYDVVGSLSNFARAAGVVRDLGPPGVILSQPAGTPAGWSKVSNLTPGGPAAAAGLAEDDLVRFDRFAVPMFLQRAGWTYAATIERGDARFHTAFAVPRPATGPPGQLRLLLVLWGLAALATASLGLLLLVRGRANRAAVLLCVLLLLYGMTSVRIVPWAPNIPVVQLLAILSVINPAAIACFKLLFALEISGGATDRLQTRLIHAAVLLLTGLSLGVAVARLIPMHVPVVGWGAGDQGMLALVNNLLVFGIIVWNYRRNDAAARNRLKIVALALAFYLLSVLIRSMPSLAPWLGQWDALAVTAVELTGLALLTYAVLRQRLFDFSFALNRTLVYGAVSFTLLASFGLAKWGVERLLPHAWHEGGAFVSAGIALALFLSFHRLRDWVEKHVERLLFSSWHRNEAALRRFAASAGHFEQVAALCRAFAEEVTRFAQGAGAALYLRVDGAGYKRCAGKLAGARATYPEEDRALALMRAERRSVHLAQAHSGLPGVLALPMLEGALAGFVLLDGKADGSDYRPDEIEALEWATGQVGVALQAQRVRDLEARVARLDGQLAVLQEVKATA
jgi:hypothetical protein